jgi:hypothetical protein
LIRNSAGRIAPKIDVRGEGGYVIVPPSIHPSGQPYTWNNNGAQSFTSAPDWLLNTIIEPAGKISITPSTEWCELIKGVVEGTRDCTIAKLAGHLLGHRINPYVALALLQSWNATCCTPSLPEKDIIRIVNSIARKEAGKRHGFGFGR